MLENGYFETGRSLYCSQPLDSDLVDYDSWCNQTIYSGYVSWSLIHIDEYYDCVIYEDPPPSPDPLDCANVPGGSAYFIQGCGCVGGTTGLLPCVTYDPCAQVALHEQDMEFRAIVNELKNKTNLTHETGYAESRLGTFNSLISGNSTSNSDNLKINIDTETIGFTHNHLDDYELVSTVNNGIVEIRKPIKMFSPADVNALMLLIQANISSGDYSKYYVNMVSSNGNYTIMFTGSHFDIKTGFDTPEWRNKYVEFYKKEDGNDEKKFLRFVNEEMNLNGVKLFKAKSNGIIEEKSLILNSNGKITVFTNPCP
ncbi:hypothetical protein [Pedobacter puniceum]|uniref:Uncharacterized protein n=1 Tax=Pedobacter puniceum TaxID=2666136 RepID=A0A7K0FQE9_9SPHI|nr:hypothetical protein [Pedobacter puniceum]MRX47277.1 hypothetical protein [Pedobacter puniceum]